MEKDTSKAKIWNRIIKKFNEARLRYVLVGGAALVIYGLPRSTIDIDIYVPAKKEILQKLFRLADELKLQSAQKSILNISHLPNLFADQWICFSYKGQDILDVFLAKDDEFQRLYTHSEIKKDKTISVRVASLGDIVIMKKGSKRPVDLADISLIKEARDIIK